MTGQEDPRRVLRRIAGDVEALLNSDREQGRGQVEASRETVRALGAPPAPVVDPSVQALAEIAARIAVCTRCPLHRTRTRTVPGQGHPHPEILFVGEGPGGEEDRQGLPFVGSSGNLLTRLIEAMELTRDAVFIANIVKCRPTVDYAGQKDRAPEPDEMATCLPYLREQIAVLKPKVIVALGATAVKGLVGLTTGITRLRGQWQSYEGVPVMPTFHPSYLLRGGGEGKARYWDVWDDMCKVLRRLGRTPPDKKRPTS